MSESQMQWKLNLTYTVFAFTAVTTVARLYTRGCLLRQLGLEDALIAFAVLGDFALVFVNRPSTIELTRLVADLIRNRNSPLVVVARAGKISFAIKMSFVTAIIYPVVFGYVITDYVLHLSSTLAADLDPDRSSYPYWHFTVDL